MPPELRCVNLHPSRRFDTGWLERMARAALPLCLAAAGGGDKVLAGLDEVEINLVDDEAIRRVHRDFMGLDGATDVITFHHGEVVISLDTAARQAVEHSCPFDREVFLYVVHGLLHLNGHTDHDDAGRAAMDALQLRIVGEVWSARNAERTRDQGAATRGRKKASRND